MLLKIVSKLFQLLLFLPETNATSNRTFSALHCIKSSYLRCLKESQTTSFVTLLILKLLLMSTANGTMSGGGAQSVMVVPQWMPCC